MWVLFGACRMLQQRVRAKQRENKIGVLTFPFCSRTTANMLWNDLFHLVLPICWLYIFEILNVLFLSILHFSISITLLLLLACLLRFLPRKHWNYKDSIPHFTKKRFAGCRRFARRSTAERNDWYGGHLRKAGARTARGMCNRFYFDILPNLIFWPLN